MMKKILIGLVVFLLVAGGFCFKPIMESFEQKPIEKSISFAIYKGYNYKSRAYDSTSVQIQIVVEKVRGKKRTVVWDKTLDTKLLKQYPTLKDVSFQNVTVTNLLVRKEHLEVNYILTYNSKGSELKMQSATVVLDISGKMFISI